MGMKNKGFYSLTLLIMTIISSVSVFAAGVGEVWTILNQKVGKFFLGCGTSGCTDSEFILICTFLVLAYFFFRAVMMFFSEQQTTTTKWVIPIAMTTLTFISFFFKGVTIYHKYAYFILFVATAIFLLLVRNKISQNAKYVMVLIDGGLLYVTWYIIFGVGKDLFKVQPGSELEMISWLPEVAWIIYGTIFMIRAVIMIFSLASTGLKTSFQAGFAAAGLEDLGNMDVGEKATEWGSKLWGLGAEGAKMAGQGFKKGWDATMGTKESKESKALQVALGGAVKQFTVNDIKHEKKVLKILKDIREKVKALCVFENKSEHMNEFLKQKKYVDNKLKLINQFTFNETKQQTQINEVIETVKHDVDQFKPDAFKEHKMEVIDELLNKVDHHGSIVYMFKHSKHHAKLKESIEKENKVLKDFAKIKKELDAFVEGGHKSLQFDNSATTALQELTQRLSSHDNYIPENVTEFDNKLGVVIETVKQGLQLSEESKKEIDKIKADHLRLFSDRKREVDEINKDLVKFLNEFEKDCLEVIEHNDINKWHEFLTNHAVPDSDLSHYDPIFNDFNSTDKAGQKQLEKAFMHDATKSPQDLEKDIEHIRERMHNAKPKELEKAVEHFVEKPSEKTLTEVNKVVQKHPEQVSSQAVLDVANKTKSQELQVEAQKIKNMEDHNKSTPEIANELNNYAHEKMKHNMLWTHVDNSLIEFIKNPSNQKVENELIRIVKDLTLKDDIEIQKMETLLLNRDNKYFTKAISNISPDMKRDSHMYGIMLIQELDTYVRMKAGYEDYCFNSMKSGNVNKEQLKEMLNKENFNGKTIIQHLRELSKEDMKNPHMLTEIKTALSQNGFLHVANMIIPNQEVWVGPIARALLRYIE